MAYVGKDPPRDGCLFCRVQSESADASNLILERNDNAFLMLNAFPYTNGHMMAVPSRHTADFTTLQEPEITGVMALVRRAIAALEIVCQPHGLNVGMNLGSAAGAGIADHLHLHIVPRWVGDTNFMGSVGDVRVMPDSLDSSYEKIALALRNVQS